MNQETQSAYSPHEDPLAEIEIDDILTIYFAEARQTPVLKAHEEKLLGEAILTGKSAAIALRELKQQKITDYKQESALNEQITAGEQATKHLILANTGLVVALANRYVGRGVPFEDLIQEGNKALIIYANRFDHRKGYRFGTFIGTWINRDMGTFVGEQGMEVKLYKKAYQLRGQIFHFINEWNSLHHKDPTIEEIMKQFHLRKSTAEGILSTIKRGLHSDHRHESKEPYQEEIIGDKRTQPPDEHAHETLLYAQIYELLHELPREQEQIMLYRFGLEDGIWKSLEEVGKHFGLPEHKVKKIQKDALDRLRQLVQSQPQDYLEE